MYEKLAKEIREILDPCNLFPELEDQFMDELKDGLEGVRSASTKILSEFRQNKKAEELFSIDLLLNVSSISSLLESYVYSLKSSEMKKSVEQVLSPLNQLIEQLIEKKSENLDLDLLIAKNISEATKIESGDILKLVKESGQINFVIYDIDLVNNKVTKDFSIDLFRRMMCSSEFDSVCISDILVATEKAIEENKIMEDDTQLCRYLSMVY